MVRLAPLPGQFAVCRLSEIPSAPAGERFWSLTIAPDEISLVCREEIAQGERIERGWRAYRIDGPMPFTLTGVVSGVTGPLAQASIPVFVISTFDTDLILIKADDEARAIATWNNAGLDV